MAKVLVSLVSDQVVPNIRFIKEFKSIVNNYIFISTDAMEKENKTNSHLNSVNISARKSKTVIVAPFNFKNIEETLLNLDLDEKNEYIINITGGTKPMSIIAMSFFSSFKKVKIFYIPIGEGVYRQVLPRLKKPKIQFLKKLTLKEYFIASGLELVAQESKISRNISHAQKLLNKFIKEKGDITNIDKINRAHEMTNPEDKVYYSGGWFEELIFSKIKTKFDLNQNQIAYNVKLKNKKSDNEYDAVFVYDNAIYIVECKAYYSIKMLKAKIEKDLYKLGALDDDFGLKSNAIYITTANIRGNNLSENVSLKERARSLNVKLFQLDDLKNDDFLSKI